MSFTETAELAPDYRISRVIRGGWQLAGGHGPVDEAQVSEDCLAYFEAGITTFDCADIYTGVEEKLGAFRDLLRARLGEAALNRLKIHTKFVPDLAVLPVIDRAYVRGVIERSLTRLRMQRLDLVQFHWWDYAAPRWAETALWLDELRREGKIDRIGGTNFDTAHVEGLVDAGVPLTSLQVQYSLLDDRPSRAMAAACERRDVKLLCYGAIAGGFLSDRWLGKNDPGHAFENRSLVKYRLIIDEFGGWALFQELLTVLRRIAGRRESDIAAVAARWALDQPQVAAVIVGARDRAHLAETLKIGATHLNDEDRCDIENVLGRRKGPAGDVYALERDRSGPHGAIMKYNLSKPG